MKEALSSCSLLLDDCGRLNPYVILYFTRSSIMCAVQAERRHSAMVRKLDKDMEGKVIMHGSPTMCRHRSFLRKDALGWDAMCRADVRCNEKISSTSVQRGQVLGYVDALEICISTPESVQP